jgi:hypothetical protein
VYVTVEPEEVMTSVDDQKRANFWHEVGFWRLILGAGLIALVSGTTNAFTAIRTVRRRVSVLVCVDGSTRPRRR